MACLTFISVLLFAMSLPQFAAGQAKAKENSQELSRPPHEVTMNNMRSMVPSLVALGWDDFFLTKTRQIELTSTQEEKLFSIGLEFLASASELDQRIQGAELELHDLLDRDQVLMRDIEFQARWVGSLRGEMVVLHLRYLLRAINVFTHDQHLKLTASLKLQNPSRAPGDARNSRTGRSVPLPVSGEKISPQQYRWLLDELRARAERDKPTDGEPLSTTGGRPLSMSRFVAPTWKAEDVRENLPAAQRGRDASFSLSLVQREKWERRPVSNFPQYASPSMFLGSRLRGPFQQVYPRPFPGGGQP